MLCLVILDGENSPTSLKVNTTRIHSSKMRTAHLLTVPCSDGESAQPPWMQTPLDTDLSLDADHPWMQTPLDADPTWMQMSPLMQTTPGCRPLWMQTPPGCRCPP